MILISELGCWFVQVRRFTVSAGLLNKKLSEIFLQLHISEKTGRGVPIVTQRYGRNAYEFRENSIVVTIPFNWMNVMGDKAGNKGGSNRSNKPHEHCLNQTQVRILVKIKK